MESVLLLVVVPQLRTWAAYFARKDADNIGTDDRIARLLEMTAAEIETYVAEQQAKPKK